LKAEIHVFFARRTPTARFLIKPELIEQAENQAAFSAGWRARQRPSGPSGDPQQHLPSSRFCRALSTCLPRASSSGARKLIHMKKITEGTVETKTPAKNACQAVMARLPLAICEFDLNKNIITIAALMWGKIMTSQV
jgi:hypothetical protein